MKYDLNNPLDEKSFDVRADYLKSKKKIVELKATRESRSIKQNSYLHVVITLYAIEFGNTLNEAKTDLKRACPFMTYEKNGKKYLVETSKQNSKELTDFIDWIRNYAAQNGCNIPTSEEYLQNRHRIDNEIERFKEYL